MKAEDFQSMTGVSRETLERFELWRQRLVEWNAHTNLVGRSTLDDFWSRHALDSWQVFEAAPEATRWLDFGSGAGFPGLAIAFAHQDRGVEANIGLVESIQKKAAFLKEVVDQTAAPAEVHACRVEDLPVKAEIDCITARAMTSLSGLLDYAAPYTEKGAICVFPKGAKHKEELTRARKSWTFDVTVIPSRTSPEAALLKLKDIVRV